MHDPTRIAQLPFPSAWVIKVIQCAVREGAVASIEVALTAKEARFRFYTSTFSLDDAKTAFLTPKLNTNLALRHLVCALWTVGVQQRRSFELSLPGVAESLKWDGAAFCSVPAGRKSVKTQLVVSLAPKGGDDWLTGAMKRAEIDAEILQTLKRWCYTCPVPLIVDGRRMDSLQACPNHGWGTSNCPMLLGFAEAEVPELLISPGTFEKQPTGAGEAESLKDARRALGLVSPRQVASVPFLLAHHFEEQGANKNRLRQRKQGESLLYWVKNGVVVQTEQLSSQKSRMTVGLFVNAEGLDTDLTTLHLRDQPERRRRKVAAIQAITAALTGVTVLNESMEELAQSARSKASWSRKIFSLAGFGAFWVSPVAGLLLAGAAFLTGKTSGQDIKRRDESYREEIAELLTLMV